MDHRTVHRIVKKIQHARVASKIGKSTAHRLLKGMHDRVKAEQQRLLEQGMPSGQPQSGSNKKS